MRFFPIGRDSTAPLSVLLIDCGDTEAMGLVCLDPDDANGQIGILFTMIGDQMLVIHLVDMVTGQDQDLLRDRDTGQNRGS